MPGPDGSIRVEVMVGMSDEGPDETYPEVVGTLDLARWEVLERTPELVGAVWSSSQRSSVARMELRISPDVGSGPRWHRPAPRSPDPLLRQPHQGRAQARLGRRAVATRVRR